MFAAVSLNRQDEYSRRLVSQPERPSSFLTSSCVPISRVLISMLSSFVWSDFLTSPRKKVGNDDDARNDDQDEEGADKMSIQGLKGKARKDTVRAMGVAAAPLYEKVLTHLAEQGIWPQYSHLPVLSNVSEGDDDKKHANIWQYSETLEWYVGRPGLDPAEGRLKPKRAQRKRQQVANMLAAADLALRILFRASSRQLTRKSSISVVEFCGGTGHITLPLAYLHPDVQFVVLDANPEATKFTAIRAKAAELRNVRTVTLSVEDWQEVFDLGIGLHACGPLTDMTMDQCLRSRAAFVLCPCCIGNVQKSLLQYPRSDRFRACLPERREYEALASAADISVRDYSEGKVGAKEGAFVLEESKRRRMCKSYVETDRRLRAEEVGYVTRMVLMNPRQCTPKNDILVGWPRELGEVFEDEGGGGGGGGGRGNLRSKTCEDWLWEEQ